MGKAPGGARRTLLAIVGVGKSHRQPWRILAVFTVLLTQPAGPVNAQNWVVEPSLGIAEVYTDNLFLAPAGSETSDWVTLLVPGISVAAKGPRLLFNASYNPEILYNARVDREDNLFQRGSAYGKLELAEQLLFLEAGARVDQSDISLRGLLSTANVNIKGNRTTVATSYVSPYLQHDLGSAARAEARFTYSMFDSDEDPTSLPDNVGRRANLRLTSGPDYRVLTWEVAYSGESITYETQQETTIQAFTTSARRLMTPTVGLLGQAGYESFDTGAVVPLEEPRWSLGFDWTPTPRTRLVATSGERLGEGTYGFEFRHRTRLTTWSAAYIEDVTTSRSQFFVPDTANTAGALDQLFLSQYPDPLERQKAVQEFIARTGLPPSLGAPVNFFSDQLFLQKRWLASVALQGVRNTLIASAYWELRRVLTGATGIPVPGDFAESESIEVTGGSLAWSWRLTARNTWNLEGGYTRSEFRDSNDVGNFTYLRAGFTRQFQPRVSGSLYYRRQANDSSQGDADYTENAAIASLRLAF